MKPVASLLIADRRFERTCAVLGLLAIGCMAAGAQAEKLTNGRPSVAELLTQPAVAECAVQSLDAEPQPTEMQPNVVMMGTGLSADPLDNYARSRDGEWQLPSASAGDDPWMRLLLLPPQRPLVVDVAVIVDGQSYRQAREKWVELLLSQAQGKYSSTKKTADTEAKPAEGTSADEPASEKRAADEAAEPSDEAEDESDVKGVTAESRKAPTVIQRLKHYVAAVGEGTDPQEVRWLLADWTGGPELIVLGPAASWQRAEAAPLWSWLDADGNHVLSSAEIAQASDRLQQADVDEDDIVDLGELLRNEKLGSPYEKQFSHPLVVVIDDDTDWYALLDDLADVYGGANASQSVDDLTALQQQEPDLVCRVSLDAKDGKAAVMSVGSSWGESEQIVATTENVITADVGGSYIEFSAASAPANKGGELATPQISIGAVVDGYPLLRLLDADGDERITRPEQRQLADLLTELDRNGDGQLSQNEIPTAIRLAVTGGPHAHEFLRKRTRAAKLRTRERLPVPSWFTDMDRNRDGELSRREFLGTSAQFDQLDRNGNGLIGDQEVQETVTAGEPP